MLFYSLDGKLPIESPDKTSLNIDSSIYLVEVENTREYLVNRINFLPYPRLQVEENQLREVQIAGLSGFEFDFIGSRGSDKPEELAFVVMLFNYQKYYMLIGTAITDFQSNLQLFKKVSSTFRQMD